MSLRPATALPDVMAAERGCSGGPVVLTLASPPPRFRTSLVVVSNQNREIFIMDNTTSPPPFPTPVVIELDQPQYTFFKKSRLEIYSPTGKVLTVISKPLPSKTDEDAIYQLWAQACLLDVLFNEINERVTLPP